MKGYDALCVHYIKDNGFVDPICGIEIPNVGALVRILKNYFRASRDNHADDDTLRDIRRENRHELRFAIRRRIAKERGVSHARLLAAEKYRSYCEKYQALMSA